MEFKELKRRALEIQTKYAEFGKQKGLREWDRQDFVRGFVGDVGDLVKLTMAQDGVREIPDSSNKIAHELADCLWSIIVIAEEYNVDLENSFFSTMNVLEERIDKGMKE